MDKLPENLEVLVLGQSAVFARQAEEAFAGGGVAVTAVPGDDAGLDFAATDRYAVIVLEAPSDIETSVDLCGRVRARSDAPLFVISPAGSELDSAELLEAGADDAIQRPISPRDLVARVRALARRARWHAKAPPTLRVGPLEIDQGAQRASLAGCELKLSRYQFALLRVLAVHAGTVLSRERLMAEAKGSADDAFDRSVDVQVCHLRTKLGDDPRRPKMLMTIRGLGYALAVP